jgi:GDPmannose 4,6-dehydratase
VIPTRNALRLKIAGGIGLAPRCKKPFAHGQTTRTTLKRALITGITGQDGSYLTELLLEQGYEVHGVVRRTSTLERSRLQHLYRDASLYDIRLFLHYADLDDPTTLRRVVHKVQPDELYHLAGQSHVGLSFEIPESTCELTAMGTLRLIEIVRDLPRPPRFYHASTSEVFGRPQVAPQDEATPFDPATPYGCAKAFATQMVRVYRQSFGLHAVNGITYNHESPRRGENFVTRKICRAAAAIKLGRQKELLLGDLAAQRDWGWAPDYVHSVEQLVETAFSAAGLNWRDHVRQDPRLLRPAEPVNLVGNPAKAKRLLGWEPQMDFAAMIGEMTRAELEAMKR